MRLLETFGYQCTRAAGSHGVWDVIGLSETDIVLVQVKRGAPPKPAEVEQMQLSKCPPNARKLVHVWQPNQRLPRVIEV
jgi:hypothetical protein